MLEKPLTQSPPTAMSASSKGMIFGLAGVLCFSFTLPATRLAVASFDPMIVGLGRAAVAGLLAILTLFFTRQSFPGRSRCLRLAVVGIGAVIGFPVLSSWAMHRVDASHGAVVLGLMPLATAIAGVVRSGERPSFGFWCAGVLGSATVLLFALGNGSGHFQAADLALFGAVILCAIGYAEGAGLAREIGGWQTICWALVLSLPVVMTALFFAIGHHRLTGPPSAWSGLAYLCVFSSFLGFFAWYHGLALGGTAKVSQCQLLQPFFTLLFAAGLLGERPAALALPCAGVVALSIVVSRKCRVNVAQTKI